MQQPEISIHPLIGRLRYNDYRAKREEYRRLQTVKGNIDQILRRERKPVKKQEQER